METKLATIAKQHGWNLLPDNATHSNRIEIRSESSNRVYVVAQNKTSGQWGCSCPGWIIKRAGRERSCKHLAAMMPMLPQARKRLK